VERTGIPVANVVSRSDLYKRSFVRAHGGDFMVITDDEALRILRFAH